MFCKKCGKEIPDLSMYCPECGAAQIGAQTEPVELKLEGSRSAKVVIQGYDNMTNAITAVRDVSGLDFIGARKIISELPAVLFTNLSNETAEGYAEQLRACGVNAVVEGGTPKPVTVEDPQADQNFEAELDAYEKAQELIMPTPAEEPEPTPVEETEPAEPEEEQPEPVETEEPSEPESSFEQDMEAFLNTQSEPKEEPEVTLTLPGEEKTKTDADFDAEMEAFLKDQ